MRDTVTRRVNLARRWFPYNKGGEFRTLVREPRLRRQLGARRCTRIRDLEADGPGQPLSTYFNAGVCHLDPGP